MKTKMIMGALIAMTAISGANAYNQADKDKCLANPDKVVWIESKGACIPVNPCNNSKYEAYCNRIFKDVQVANKSNALDLIRLYSEKFFGTRYCDIESKWIGNTLSSDGTLIGDDYYGCKLNGNYIVFQFDDVSESNEAVGFYGIHQGVCLVFGGQPDWKSMTPREYFCTGVSEADCKPEIGRKYDESNKKCTGYMGMSVD